METIAVQVNEKRLLANLGHAFSNSRTVLSELMQNARRAKATKVEFRHDGDTLTVVDDGVGITNFSDLLHVAESGWDKETKESENPFGMGWLSCLFSATHVTVKSLGKMAEFDSIDAIGFENIELKSCKDTGQTEITLRGFKLQEHEVKSSLAIFAQGFPIRVFHNGSELERPYAFEALTGVEEVDGMHIWVNWELACSKESQHYMPITNCIAFLQGLPIYDGYRDSSNRFRLDTRMSVIHLDSRQFAARMPDRDRLIDEDKNQKRIGAGVELVMRSALYAAKATMKPVDFVDRYWHLGRMLRVTNVFNDVPVLHQSVCTSIEDAPIVRQSWDLGDNLADLKHHVMQDDVLSGKHTLCYLGEFDQNDTNAAAWQLAANLEWTHVDIDLLDPGHWAHRHVIDLSDPEEGEGQKVRVEPLGVVGEGIFSHGWVDAKIIACSSYRITTADGKHACVETANASSTMVGEKWAVVVPAGDVYPGWVVEQLADYTNEHDEYQDGDRDEDSDALNNFVMALRGENPIDTMKKVLAEGRAGKFPNLVGKSFVVTVVAPDDIKVTLL